MTLRRGETIALVGENGSGKSTLAKLLAGLYLPDAGAIRWDGVDLAEVGPDTVRDRVAVVMQEPTRWPFSAGANITIGRYDRPHDQELISAAARAGDAHEFIVELSRGYDTLLSRHFVDGADLSGGQWQRLAVSRAFYREADLLICDEPTANLDARAEHDVYRRLRELAAGRTVVLITHRMASVRTADRIYVLDHGELIEQGDHEALMTLDGTYASLFRLQAEAYQPGGERSDGDQPGGEQSDVHQPDRPGRGEPRPGEQRPGEQCSGEQRPGEQRSEEQRPGPESPATVQGADTLAG